MTLLKEEKKKAEERKKENKNELSGEFQINVTLKKLFAYRLTVFDVRRSVK